MENSNFWRRSLIVAAALLLVGTSTAFAQLQTGNLYGKVTDNQGDNLPGVTVTLTGNGPTQIQVTNAEGQYRFLGLSPGSYAVRAELEGFSTVDRPNVSIAVGRNTTVDFQLSGAVEEVITVTSESPLLDERKISTGTTVSQTELEKIPTARDPWVILQQTPGVLVDRINVGGNESGQQSSYISPGTDDDNSVWAVDGVVITDMGAIGSSPSYYNFDSFEQMQITTGGSDASLATGGVTMNMVTKRGTNEWRFSGRYLLTDDSWQSDLDFDDSELGPNQASFGGGNRIVDIKDFGLEGGGPIVKDKAWIWASYGVQEVDLLTVGDLSDFTELESYAAKLNAQLGTNNSLIGFYHYGDKIKIGRNVGPTRSQPTSWNQDGPTDIYKIEDTHIFSSNFYLTGMLSYVGGGFQLVPQGGGVGDLNFPNVVRDSNGVWQGSFLLYQTDRPQEQAKLDGSYFFNTGASSHELRFGVALRNAQVDSYSAWPGEQLYGLADLSFGTNVFLGFSQTVGNTSVEVDYTQLYVQDTLTFGNLTANVGLRYDQQEGKNLASVVGEAPVSQGVLVGGNFQGGDPGFEWESITPRLGLTWALGEERDTLLRASYAQFADQLSSGNVGFVNPTASQTAYFFWYDNGDGALTANEVGPFLGFSSNVDPANPGLLTLNQIDPSLDAPITDEIVLSVEHSLLPEFVIGGTVTLRNYSDILEFETLVEENGVVRTHQRSDYVLAVNHQGTLPNGQSFNVPQYTLRNGVNFTNGSRMENGDREQDYLGYSLTFNKRLANRWLLRGHVTFQDWEWSVPDSENEDPTPTLPGATIDGGAVLLGSGTGSGAKGNVYINSNWSFDISGMYQIAPDRPWGFNVAANVNGREGYPIPYNSRQNGGEGFGTRNILAVSDVEDFRNDDVVMFSARLEKEFAFSDWGLTVSVDGFNLFNESYVLQREARLPSSASAPFGTNQQGLGSGAWVQEVVSPRVFRIGARINFR